MRLGQNILLDKHIIERIIKSAELDKDDIVFEIGSGTGILTRELCERAGYVISCEIDKKMYQEARSLSYNNLELYNVDGYRYAYIVNFDKFVSNIPYYKSRDTIELLAKKEFELAVIMVQKDFFEKILYENKAISFIARHCFTIEHIIDVSRDAFKPIPHVDSALIRLRKRNTLTDDEIKTIKLLYSFKGRKIKHASHMLVIDHTISDKRVEELNEEEIISILHLNTSNN
ncbi:MAG: rRNA adenine dimethyltransferase family protein [Candidatus Nitrosocaldaceae archaeon]